MTAYIGQYNEIIVRCKERNRRRVDMDRFKAEVRDLTLHPPEKHPDKLPKVLPIAYIESGRILIHFPIIQAQRNYALAKAAFEELNTELLRDIPLLYADRLNFFDPCFATVRLWPHSGR